MRINDNLQLPFGVEPQLRAFLYDFLGSVARRVNGLSDGSFEAVDGKASAIPTTGTWKKGHFLRNSSPAELGTSPNKYVVHGWICTASGAPGTWLEQRMLTGN